MTNREIQKLEYNAYHDQLTGLYNNFYYREELKRINTHRNYPISVIFVDVDKLKIINDIFGHKAGDEALKYVAEILADSVRQDDMVARIGGDEFVIVLRDTDEKRVKQVTATIENLNRTKGMRANVSIGSTTIQKYTKSILRCVPVADKEMYQNKMEKWHQIGFSEYQLKARTTAIYRKKYKITYPTLGLAGESGEVCEKIKKLFRDNNGKVTSEIKETIEKELGDVLWYLSNLASDLELDLNSIATRNLDKLFSRKKRGKLKGSGDNR